MLSHSATGRDANALRQTLDYMFAHRQVSVNNRLFVKFSINASITTARERAVPVCSFVGSNAALRRPRSEAENSFRITLKLNHVR